MEFFLLIILVILFVCTYFFFNKAYIPIKAISFSALTQMTDIGLEASQLQSGSSGTLELDVSFAIYIIAIFSWFGWYPRDLDDS